MMQSIQSAIFSSPILAGPVTDLYSPIFHPLQDASPWLAIGVSLGAGLIIIFIIYTILLLRLVNIKTMSLRESEEKFKRFFLTSKDPVFITTRDGKWIDANDATVSLFGYESQEELFRTPVSQIYLNPLERPNVLKEIDRNGCVKDLPVDMVDRNGKILHTLLTASATSEPDGSVSGYQGTIRDNTALVSSQRRLRQSRESLNMAITGTGAGLWDWDIRTNFIDINEHWANIIGYKKSELVPFSIADWEKLSHPADLEISNKKILEHFAGDSFHYQAEMRMKHKNGSWVWILNQGRVLERDDDRSPLRMVGTAQDITERVKIREEIQEYADQLEALYEVTESLSSTLSLKELLDLILVKLDETLEFDSASIFLLEEGELRVETVLKHPHPELVVGKTFPTTNLLLEEIQEKKNPIIIDNAMRDTRFQGWGQMHYVKGWLGVPLVIQDRLIGYITLDSKVASAFGAPEAKLANLFASQAAQAIHNARLYERITQSNVTLESRIEKRTEELTKMVDHMAGREMRMAELKKVIEQLRQQLLENNIEPAAQDPLKDWMNLNI